MKQYVKPALEVTELRVNESIAANPLGTVTEWFNNGTTRAMVTTFDAAKILEVNSAIVG